MTIKQAVILAAGEGQRLRPFTVNRPKAMISIAGKPILNYVIEALAENGIRRIVIVVGYKKEQIYNYLESGDRFGVDITFATQPRQLGSAHALLMASDWAEEEFLVLSGDNLIAADTIAPLVAASQYRAGAAGGQPPALWRGRDGGQRGEGGDGETA
jgi:NDP-sugar pyrophosphorylase family protein